jgi:gliding motility-associated-like protein
LRTLGLQILLLLIIHLGLQAQCNGVLPRIVQFTVENNTQVSLTVEKPSNDAYQLTEKILYSSSFTADKTTQTSISESGLYTINIPLNEGSCYRLESKGSDCPPSQTVCLPEWEILNEEKRNVLIIKPINIDEVQILKNSVQIERYVAPNGEIQLEDTDIECRREEVYRLVVQHGESRITTVKKPVKALAGSCGVIDIMIPSGFSPNGDGINESFGAIGSQIDFISLLVYDRWRNIVFSTPRIDIFWNGTFENTGAELPNGIYFYQLKKLNENAEIQTVTGNLTLVR